VLQAGRGAAWRLATVLHNLASLEQARGELAGAERHLREALALTQARGGPARLDLARMRVSLALLLQRRGADAEAVALAREAQAVLVPLVGPSDPWLAGARRLLRASGNGNGANPPRPPA
jgi:hypothetical protein